MSMTSKLLLALPLALALIHARGKCTAQTSSDAEFKRHAVYKSSDQGVTWAPMNDGLPDDALASYFATYADELVLATDNQGLFITENKRTRWKRLGGGLPDVKVTALHVNGEEMFAGVHRRGVFVSQNGGKDWLALNAGLPNLNVRTILKHNGHLLVGTDIGIYLKRDGANDWEEKFSRAQVSSLNEHDGKIVAGTTAGVLLSTDGGDTWNSIHNAGALHNSSIANGRVFALYISSDVFASDDWGATWTRANYTPTERSYIYELLSAGDALLMSNNYGVFRSIDGGKNWQHIFKEDQNKFFFDLITMDGVVYGGTRFSNELPNGE